MKRNDEKEKKTRRKVNGDKDQKKGKRRGKINETWLNEDKDEKREKKIINETK